MAGQLDYAVTILRNRDPNSNAIDLFRIRPGDEGTTLTPTDLIWPPGIFSLSHIAVPFRSDDLVYGTRGDDRFLALGSLAPRGEAGVLMLNSNYFLRARNNPFYAYQARTIVEWVDDVTGQEVK